MDIKSVLKQGLSEISLDSDITLHRYTKLASADGLTYLVSDASYTQDIKASLHISDSVQLAKTHTYTAKSGSMTTSVQLPDDTYLYVVAYHGELYGVTLSDRRYEQADLWHYRLSSLPIYMGDAVDGARAISSIYGDSRISLLLLLAGQPIPVYMAYAVADTAPPPYVVLSVDDTKAHGMYPLDTPTKLEILMTDSVTLSGYGVTYAQMMLLKADLCGKLAPVRMGLVDFGMTKQGAIDKAVGLDVISSLITSRLKVSYYQDALVSQIAPLILSATILVLVNYEI